jgi:hypothetical protein
MVTQQVAMGVVVAAACAVGLWNDRLLLTNSRYGRWLTRLFGPVGGLWALRVLLFLGIVFGILLAADVIRPIQWKKR